MTSRFHGSFPKDEPRSQIRSSGIRSVDREVCKKSRSAVPRKDSRGKSDGLAHDRNDYLQGRLESNGWRNEDEVDPDLLYRRSKEHFATWDIRDIVQEDGKNLEETTSGGAGNRKSRFELFESDAIDDGKTVSNGDVRSRQGSNAGRCVGSSNRRYDHGGCWGSREMENGSRSKSRDREDGQLGLDRTVSPNRIRYITGLSDARKIDNEDDEARDSRHLLGEMEHFGSVGRRYAGNRSPEQENDRIRAMIDSFKSREEEENELQASWKSRRGRSSGGTDNDDYGKIDPRSDRRFPDDLGPVDELRSIDDRGNGWRSSLGRRSSRNREHVDGKSQRNDERDRRVEQRSSEETDVEEACRRRRDTYSMDRGGGRRGSRVIEEEQKEEQEIDRDSAENSVRRRRRSYAYEGSPEDFDVRIQRYERALPGPRRDPELSRKSSVQDRDNEVKRRSSLKNRPGQEKLDCREDDQRHGRPVTPSEHVDREIREDSRNGREGFSSKDWHESNRQFAIKYLQERSKVQPVRERSTDVESEGRRGPANLKKEIARDSTTSRQQPSREIYFGELRTPGTEENGVNQSARIPRTADSTRNERIPRNYSGTECNGATTVVKIRNSAVRSPAEAERRWRRDDDDQRVCSDLTPTRIMWEYREGGVKITDVEEGQPCLQCGDICPGFSPHSWRKNCTSCKCPREAHDVCHEEWVSVRARLGLKSDGASGSAGFDPRDRGLAWAPPGLPPHKVEEYFSMLPDISVPQLGTPGERYRDRQLATQLPKQDLARVYCRHLDPQHSTSADDFMAARNEIALDIGSVQENLDCSPGVKCGDCRESIKYGALVVSASKLGLLYHPACFRCMQCRELLVDLAYCVHDDALFCERHYAEQLKPRCAACDELIFSGEYTKAMNKDWHSGHFCCWQCDESLTGQRYVLRDEHPYCIKCYESVFANGCEECNKIIGIDSKDLSYKDKHWHEACFLCNKCRVSLVDKQFGSKVDKIYCGNCYDAQFASRCDGCGEIFRAGTKKMEYKTRQWHEKCFCCVVCKNPIGTKSFIPREQEIYCAGCYEDKFATRCVKCNKIITSGGVTYKNEPWHRDCFTCSNCNNSLAGQRFTSRDEKPYCADCFGELFAKRCTACTKPITGIGGTRFISFEDRHWHNDCFICAGCKTSLVGRGFITDGDDIICPECAKQKVM